MSLNIADPRLARLRGLKIALVHEWLVSQRGGENVLDALCEMFPQAGVHVLLHKPGVCTPRIEAAHPQTSLLQKVPGIEKSYQYFLAVMPLAVRTLSLGDVDLVISSSHCVAKGVSVPAGAVHVSYIHAPMRYMWDRFDEYFNGARSGLLTRTAARVCRPYLQAWDKWSAKGPLKLVANSRFIAGRIREIYGRDAEVVHPFCELDRFRAAYERRLVKPPGVDAPYLMVTALVPYKRVDRALEAFRGLDRDLWIVGDGADRERLERSAGPRVKFLGPVPNEELVALYAQARALIFPGIEDFGIVPVEAMASGLPVIAFGEGGVLDTVVDGITGMLYKGGAASDLAAAVKRFEGLVIEPSACHDRAAQFSRDHFQEQMLRVLDGVLGK